jgi:hypothetical protein
MPPAFVLVNNLDVEVTYLTTLGTSAPVPPSARYETRTDVGAQVRVGPYFTAPLVMPREDLASAPLTGFLLPTVGLQYNVLQTVTGTTVTLHPSPWRTLLLANPTPTTAVLRLQPNNDPVVLPARSQVVHPAPAGLVTQADLATATKAMVYAVNPGPNPDSDHHASVPPSTPLRFRGTPTGVHVSSRAPGLWVQVGPLSVPGSVFAGAWTVLEGAPVSALPETGGGGAGGPTSGGADDTDACATTSVTQ